MALDVRPHRPQRRVEALALGGLHLDQLAPPCHEGRQLLGLLVRQRAGRGMDDLGKVRQDLPIQDIGLGSLARCPTARAKSRTWALGAD